MMAGNEGNGFYFASHLKAKHFLMINMEWGRVIVYYWGGFLCFFFTSVAIGRSFRVLRIGFPGGVTVLLFLIVPSGLFSWVG